MIAKIFVLSSILFLAGCQTFGVRTTPPTEDLLPPVELAECTVKYELILPPPLDLSKYTMEPQYPFTQEDHLKLQELILVLKNRIFELQEIIKDANK